MKYFIFHCNTGGYNSDTDSLIEIGCIFEDTKNKLDFEKIPKYKKLIYQDIYTGNSQGLFLNSDNLNKISIEYSKKSEEIIPINKLAPNLYSWMINYVDNFLTDKNISSDFDLHGKIHAVNELDRKKILINVGGKNFGVFQHSFLKKIPHIDEYISFNHRFIDPSILFFENEDDSLPNTEECKKRAKFQNFKKTNDILMECWDVISMLRLKLNY